MTNEPLLNRKLAWCLLWLRLGIASVFVMWTADKFVNPEHTAAVFKKFYAFDGLSNTHSYGIGAVQSVFIICFIIGLFRTYSYGLILVLHTISTVSSYKAYLAPWTYPHLLFFAAIPMLAACVTLWWLRKYDLFTVDAARAKAKLVKHREITDLTGIECAPGRHVRACLNHETTRIPER
jgi:putative oxidoreductase